VQDIFIYKMYMNMFQDRWPQDLFITFKCDQVDLLENRCTKRRTDVERRPRYVPETCPSADASKYEACVTYT
jgi:hypothetical protein